MRGEIPRPWSSKKNQSHCRGLCRRPYQTSSSFKKTRITEMRFAPSFKIATKNDVKATSPSHPYTSESFMEFLGWNRHKIDTSLMPSIAVEQGLLSDRGFERQVPKNPGIGEQGLPGPQGPQVREENQALRDRPWPFVCRPRNRQGLEDAVPGCWAGHHIPLTSVSYCLVAVGGV
jgi:hypothetical protein